MPLQKITNSQNKATKRKKGTRELQNSQKTISGINNSLTLIITLNVNGLNSLKKNRHKVAGWIKKQTNTQLHTTYKRFISA